MAPWRTESRRAAAAVLPLALAAAAGCEIARPELPKFTTSVTIPLGIERVSVAEIARDESFLAIGADSLLSFSLAGDPDTLVVETDLSADLPGTDIAVALGEFSPATDDPVAFAFALRAVHPPAAALDGATVPVPGFVFDLASDAADLPDVGRAEVTAGALEITVANGLPVPVGGASAPERVTVELVDPAGGATLVTVDFPAPVPAGATASGSADLAGVTLPDSVAVRLRGGSGGSASPVPVDADAVLGVTARLRGLRVAAAEAVLGPQSFAASVTVELPDSVRLIEAEVAGGALQIAIDNDLPLPVTAVLTLPEVFAPGGEPVVERFDLAARAGATRSVPLAGGAIRAGGGEPLAALTIEATATTAGSGGRPVAVSAADGLRARLLPTSLSFGAVTGEIPRRSFALDPVTEAIDLPAEMEGIALTAAALVLAVENGAGVTAHLDFTLTGRGADGDLAVLAGDAAIAPSRPARAPARTEIVFDEGNSAVVEFLNILPVEITLAGAVRVGGDGEIGTVRPGDRAVLNWRLDAPLAVVVQGATVRGDPRRLALDEDLRRELDARLGGARLIAEITNHLPLAVEIRVLAGEDPATLAQAPALVVGPLRALAGRLDEATGTVAAAVVSRNEIALTAAEADVLSRPGLHTLVEVSLPSTGGRTVALRAADWVTVAACVQAELEVDE